jgi:hypothetical protein
MIYYLITYKQYGKTRRATEIFSKLKRESESWNCFKGNRNNASDLIRFKYENIESVVKTQSFRKYMNFI